MRRRQAVAGVLNIFDYSAKLPKAEGVLSAHVMPAKLNKSAELRYREKGRALYAHVEKGRKRKLCQDTAIALLSDDISIIGVFDGYGAGGDVYSHVMGNAVLSLGYKRRSYFRDRLDMAYLVKDAVPMALESIKCYKLPEGGTTAVVAVILPDGRYFLGGVADSAVYILHKNNIERLMTYDKVIIHDFEEKSITDAKITPREYASARNVIMCAISGNGLSDDAIETAEGVLQKGMRLMLTSDGITKNLAVGLAENGMVKDVSGCADLGKIMGNKTSIRRIGETILSKIRLRIFKVGEDDFNIVKKKDGTAIVSQDDDLSVVIFALD